MNRFSDEGGLVVCHDKADDDLEGEPGVTDTLDVEERWVRFLPLFFHPPRCRLSRPRVIGARRGVSAVVDVEGDVAKDGHSHAVVCFEAEDKNRRNDEEDGDTGHHLQHIRQNNTASPSNPIQSNIRLI